MGNRHKASLLLLAGATFSATAVFVLAGESKPERSRALEAELNSRQNETARTTAPHLPQDSADDRQNFKQPPESVSAVGAFLRSRAEGDLIMSRLRERGVDITQLRMVTETESEARENLRQKLTFDSEEIVKVRENRLAWVEPGGTLDQYWVRQNLYTTEALTEDELLILTAELLPYQAEYELAIDEYLADLDRAVQSAVQSGGFDSYPYMSPVDPGTQAKLWKPKGGSFFSDGMALPSGWGGSFVLFRDDYPKAAASLSRMLDLKHIRHDAGLSLVDSWR